MNYLAQLTPAEVLILTKADVTHKELLKITFIDLVLKNILKIFEVQKQAHIREPIRIYKYVTIGQNFKHHQALVHEKVFLSPFEKENTLELLFQNHIRIGYQNASTAAAFKSKINSSYHLKKCFSQNFFQRLFSSYSLTPIGRDLKLKVQQEIDKLELEFSGLTTIENQKAIALIKIIGANIFLLSNVDYQLLNQIDKELGTDTNKDGTFDGSGCGSIFDDYSFSFDSSCGSDGGDSGCGGCGGCGGD